jgi:uncharacterized protein YggE
MRLHRFAPLIGAALLAGCAAAGTGAVPVPGDAGITVTGIGRVSVRPDLAVVDVGVEARTALLADATAEVNRRMREVLARVKALGVADADVRTTVFRIEPVSEPRQPPSETSVRIVGYRVVNVVEVRARDVDRVGPIVDAAVGAGANVVGQIQFRLADPVRAEAEARRLAVQAAAETARQTATAAGVRLGRLLATSEATYAPVSRARLTMAAAGAPVEAGELEVAVNVTARYAIEP